MPGAGELEVTDSHPLIARSLTQEERNPRAASSHAAGSTRKPWSMARQTRRTKGRVGICWGLPIPKLRPVVKQQKCAKLNHKELEETLAFLPGCEGLGCSEPSSGKVFRPRVMSVFTSVPKSVAIWDMAIYIANIY